MRQPLPGVGRSPRAGFPLRLAEHVALRVSHRLGAGAPRPIPCVVLKVTDACNARCATCNLGLPTAQRSSSMMPRSVATRVLDALAARGALFAGFVGGEPLLYPPLFDVLEHARALGLRTNLNTHGAFVTEAAARRLAEVELSYVSVSLDSPDPARNEAIRRGIRTEDVLAALARLARFAPATAVSIGMTVTRQNVGEMAAMCGLASRVGARYLKFQPFHSHLDQLAPGPDLRADLRLTAEDAPLVEACLEAAGAEARRLGLLTNARTLRAELGAAMAGARTLPCVAGSAILFVAPSGRAGGCPEKLTRASLADVDLEALLEAEPSVFRFAQECPLLPGCFDTTYGELSHLHGRRGLGLAADLLDRVLFYR